MSSDLPAFRYVDMQRQNGDTIKAEDWNTAMQAISQLLAGSAPAAGGADGRPLRLAIGAALAVGALRQGTGRACWTSLGAPDPDGDPPRTDIVTSYGFSLQGQGTKFLSELRPGDRVLAGGCAATVWNIRDDGYADVDNYDIQGCYDPSGAFYDYYIQRPSFLAEGGNVRIALPAFGKFEVDISAASALFCVKGPRTTLDQPPWTDAELASGLQAFGGGYNPVQFFLDSLGIVHLRGTLGPAAPTSPMEAGVLFTLPAGCRPEFIENHLAYAGAIVGKISIFPDGKVFLSSDGHASVSLDGITFRAAN